MKSINLRWQMPDEEADALAEKLLGHDEGFDMLIDDDCDVFRPDGQVLLHYRTRVLTAANSARAYRTLKRFHFSTNNRGMAGGIVDPEKIQPFVKKLGYVTDAGSKGVQYRHVKRDGSLSNTNHTNEVNSGIIGYFDRNPRFPYCRQTAFVYQHPKEWAEVVPYLQEVSGVFERTCPERFAAQKSFVERTAPQFVIPGSVFTTITVNRNFQTACHKDVGDLAEGFGVMTVFRSGSYRGGAPL